MNYTSSCVLKLACCTWERVGAYFNKGNFRIGLPIVLIIISSLQKLNFIV